MSVLPDTNMIKIGWQCKCPQCQKASIYKGKFSVELNDICPECGLDLSKNDSGDGPAVFMIFILGFSVVPLSLFVAYAFDMPLWLHTIIWSIVILGLTVGMLKPLKAYIIALQYKHRPRDWEE